MAAKWMSLGRPLKEVMGAAGSFDWKCRLCRAIDIGALIHCSRAWLLI